MSEQVQPTRHRPVAGVGTTHRTTSPTVGTWEPAYRYGVIAADVLSTLGADADVITVSRESSR